MEKKTTPSHLPLATVRDCQNAHFCILLMKCLRWVLVCTSVSAQKCQGWCLRRMQRCTKAGLRLWKTSEPEIFCAPEWKYGRFIFKHLIQMADAICSDYENSSPKKFCLLALMLFQILMTFFPPKKLIPLIFPSWRNQRYFFSKTRCIYTRLTIQCRMTSLLSQRTSHVIGQFSSI